MFTDYIIRTYKIIWIVVLSNQCRMIYCFYEMQMLKTFKPISFIAKSKKYTDAWWN